MGHIINPISTRLGINIFWNNVWTLNNNHNYSLMNKNNIFFFKFLNWVLKSKKYKKKNIIFSHYIIYNSKNNININIYYYDPSLEKFKYKKKKLFRSFFFFRKKRNFFKKKKLYIKLYQYLLNKILPYMYWFILTKNWINYIKFNNFDNIKYKFNINNIDFNNITPNVISTYLAKRLIKKHSLNYTIKPILRDLYIRLKQKRISGYKILCTGRFTRRQIAEHNWYKMGPVSNNNFSKRIIYSQTKIRLKYGTCGIKVWIDYGIKKTGSVMKFYKLILPFYANFKYDLKLFNNNFNILFKNNSWSFLVFKWKYYKLKLNNYKVFLFYKCKMLIYIYFHLFILLELNYLNRKFIKKNINIKNFFLKKNFNIYIGLNTLNMKYNLNIKNSKKNYLYE